MKMTKQQKEDIAEVLNFTMQFLHIVINEATEKDAESSVVGIWDELVMKCGYDCEAAKEIWDSLATSKEKRILDEYLKKKREA